MHRVVATLDIIKSGS